MRHAFHVAVAFATLDAVWLGDESGAAPAAHVPHAHRRPATTPARERRGRGAGLVAEPDGVERGESDSDVARMANPTSDGRGFRRLRGRPRHRAR
jgi:hypothetical protein